MEKAMRANWESKIVASGNTITRTFICDGVVAGTSRIRIGRITPYPAVAGCWADHTEVEVWLAEKSANGAPGSNWAGHKIVKIAGVRDSAGVAGILMARLSSGELI